MKDAKSIETELENTTQRIPTNEHPLNEKAQEPFEELPPNYDSVRIEPTPAKPNVLPVTPIINAAQPQFGHSPVQCTCPNCKQNVLSTVETSYGIVVWLICLVLIFVGCWLGCCLIPFFLDDLKNKIHYCPQCGTMLGEKKLL